MPKFRVERRDAADRSGWGMILVIVAVDLCSIFLIGDVEIFQISFLFFIICSCHHGNFLPSV